MRFDVYLNFELPHSILRRLEIVTEKLDRLLQKERAIMSDMTDALDRAEAAAKANSDAEDSGETLITTLAGIVKQLQTNGTDPATLARINALSQALSDRAAKFGVAIAANTPAAVTPPAA